MTKSEKFSHLMRSDPGGHGLKARSVRATLWTSASSFCDFVTRIGSIAILARLISPEHFGLFLMVTAATAIVDQFRELGLSSATVQRPTITHHEVSNLFWLNVGVSLVLALILAGASPYIAKYYGEPEAIGITCVLAINVFLAGLLVQHQALLTRQLRMGNTAAVRLAASLISTAAAILLAWAGWGYWALVWRELIRTIIQVVGVWFCLPWLPSRPSRKVDVRQMVAFGANLTGANIYQTLCGSASRFLLGKLWGPAPLANFRQAHQVLAAPTDQLLSPIYQVAQPALSNLQAEPERYRNYFLRLVSIVALITMPLSLFTAVYAREVTLVLLGKNWLDATELLRLISIATFIRQTVGCTSFVLLTRGRSNTYLKLALVGSTASLIGTCVGVRWGTTGVAIAEVAIAYLLIGPRLYWNLKDSPITSSDYLRILIRPVVASLVMTLALILTRQLLSATNPSLMVSLVIGSVIGGIAFSATWLLLPGGRTETTKLAYDIINAVRTRRAART